MNSLGVQYWNGNGVPRNRVLGRQYFEKAAALGNREASRTSNSRGTGAIDRNCR